MSKLSDLNKQLVKLRRRQLGLTQRELAQLSGTAPSNVGHIERLGWTYPSAMYRIFKQLGLEQDFKNWIKVSHPNNYYRWIEE